MSGETNMRSVPCPRCGQGMHPELTKTTIWVGERVVIVEDIPAMVCDACMEQFYDENTTEAIRRLTEEGFPSDEIKREILVSIYSLEKRMQRYKVASEQPQASVTVET
jgi:YgiT-type zinc finger domain-containing protein